MSDFVVVPAAGQYSVSLADLQLFADAACELDGLNGYIDPDFPPDNQRITALVERTHAAIERIAGPDAAEIYAPDDGSTITKGGADCIPLATPHA